MTIPNFVSPHVHVQSLDSASTPERFAEREVELGTGYLVCTDHGTLEATRPVYDMCAKGGKFHGKLTPVLGVEAYFRDDNCPILLGNGVERTPDRDDAGNVIAQTFREHFKYAHITLHALDEQGFFALTKKLSDADFRAEKHGSERKPLFSWDTLAELGSHNITGTSGCLIGMVGRHLLQNNDLKTAVQYYERTRSMFKPGNFLVELMPHATDKNWTEEVIITYTDQTTERFKPWKSLKTDVGSIKAEDLAKNFHKHKTLNEVMESRKWVAREPKTIFNVEHRTGFMQNECRPWCADGDYQKDLNKFLFGLAKKYGDPVLVSDDSHFATPDEKVVQDVRLMQHGGSWRFSESHHRMSSAEAWQNFSTKLGCSEAQFSEWVENTHAWASRFKEFKFSPRESLPTKFYPEDTLKHTYDLIEKHGRMRWNDPAWKARLDQEIKLLHSNGTIDMLPYFFPDEEVCQLYLDNDELTGPGRGSAAGLALAYLLGITHVDPLRYKLSVDRFITLDRIQTGKYPDIDQDLPHRNLLVDPIDSSKGWLAERFGRCVARVSTDTKLRLKSSIRDVHRALYGRVDGTVEGIAKSLADPPQGIDSYDHIFGYEDDLGVAVKGQIETDPKLQAYVNSYPKEWEVVQRCLGLSRQKGLHACAVVISNYPIDEFIPMTSIGGVRATSFVYSAVEAMGGLKVDFLNVNSIKDIGAAVRLIQARHAPQYRTKGSVTINDRKVPNLRVVPMPDGSSHDVWDLPNDPAVYRDIATGKVETVFQLDGGAARQGLREFRPIGDKLPINSIEGLAAFTALGRPGPLDAFVEDEEGNRYNMLVEYARRARGEKATGAIEVLNSQMPETFGVIVYQEQLQALFQNIGDTTAIEANNFRGRISKKKMVEINKKDRPLFMKGAIPKLGQAEADRLWGMMETFGQYAFNKSHAVCYMVTAYACAYLKHHYPLEWWTAVLQNAERKEVDEKFWRYINQIVLLPDIIKSKSTFVIEGESIRAPLWLVSGIGEKAQAQLSQLGEFTNIEEMLTRIEEYRNAHPRPGTKKDKITGEVVAIVRKGLSPLNDSILKKLTVCGVLDSLFPVTDADGLPMTTTDRLALFEQTAAKVRGLKKYKGTATKFNLTSDARQYQYRKSLMPAYSAPLTPILQSVKPSDFTQRAGKASVYRDPSGDSFTVVNARQFEHLSGVDIFPPSGSIQVALPVYVVGERRFSYTQKSTGSQVTACELAIDVDGSRMSVVKWPGKAGLPPAFKQDLVGSMGVLCFSRNKPGDPFFVLNYHMLVEPLTNDKEESSND